MKTIHFVIPAYNEAEVIENTVNSLNIAIENLIASNKLSNEIKIYICDDGSIDSTWQIISKLHNDNDRIKGIKLSANFGQQKAIYAGLMAAKDSSDAVITLDADLQDDISLLEKFVDEFDKGYDIVYGVRSNRDSDSFFKKFTAESFYLFMRILGVNIIFNHAEYRLMSKFVLNQLAQYREANIFLRGMMPLISNNSSIIMYERTKRRAGNTKFPFFKSLSLALDGITSFSLKPLRLISFAGMIVMIIAFELLQKSFAMFSIWFLASLQIISIGIVGEYIGKAYIESKNRPLYIIEKQI